MQSRLAPWAPQRPAPARESNAVSFTCRYPLAGVQRCCACVCCRAAYGGLVSDRIGPRIGAWPRPVGMPAWPAPHRSTRPKRKDPPSCQATLLPPGPCPAAVAARRACPAGLGHRRLRLLHCLRRAARHRGQAGANRGRAGRAGGRTRAPARQRRAVRRAAAENRRRRSLAAADRAGPRRERGGAGRADRGRCRPHPRSRRAADATGSDSKRARRRWRRN